MKNTLLQHNIKNLYHTIPLHYLIFICKTKKLYSKEKLISQGFNSSHFRSSSKNADIKRGFDKVVHCTNNPFPPILISKLNKGYQHFEISIKTENLLEDEFLLCKYNIAKNRGLYTESSVNGRCYDGYKIPLAKTIDEKNGMLTSVERNQHIEILIKNELIIPNDAEFRFFSIEDAKIASDFFLKLKLEWPIVVIKHSFQYNVDYNRKKEVLNFLEYSYANDKWRGNGLEFDR